MHDNLTSIERKDIVSLRSRYDILIQPANKGSATVVMSREEYLAKVISHLQNEKFYLKLDEEPMSHYAKEVTLLLTEMTDKLLIRKLVNTFSYKIVGPPDFIYSQNS